MLFHMPLTNVNQPTNPSTHQPKQQVLFLVYLFIHPHTYKHTPTTQPNQQALFLAVENHPWQVVVLLRLLPVPIGAKNYGMVRL